MEDMLGNSGDAKQKSREDPHIVEERVDVVQDADYDEIQTDAKDVHKSCPNVLGNVLSTLRAKTREVETATDLFFGLEG